MRLAILTAALLALLPATALADDLVIDGRGWGHGVGLSQYGAYGYALEEGRDFQFIVGHYYTGTTVGTAPGTSMRVRLKRARAPKISGATRARAANGRRVRLSERRSYRFRAYKSDRIRIVNTRTGHTRARVRAPVRVTGGDNTTLRGLAENGVRNGLYRSRLILSRDRRAVLVVNSIGIERYLYGVVPREMPSGWPAEALKAQAVVARSYALRSRRPSEPYDVFADVRSQVYGGVLAETDATTAAVRATRRRVVMAGGEIAQTFFSSTSGGRTAGNDEVFGGTPISYLRPVDDPHDDLSPYHTWTARFTKRKAERMLGDAVSGKLRGLRVVSRTPSDRAATVLVRGSRGNQTVSGATIRARLGLRSTWITGVAGP
ncbi:MAG TPA: SpoIID/LytB domain-containing protein [Solirubrobacteraceae bacterium]|nr:SpoIID/LytB domain-containing protein [Solirubrobacteraceae bacterium]